ncbi:unnamed protein product, partial [Sphagnum jensenii]
PINTDSIITDFNDTLLLNFTLIFKKYIYKYLDLNSNNLFKIIIHGSPGNQMEINCNKKILIPTIEEKDNMLHINYTDFYEQDFDYISEVVDDLSKFEISNNKFSIINDDDISVSISKNITFTYMDR